MDNVEELISKYEENKKSIKLESAHLEHYKEELEEAKEEFGKILKGSYEEQVLEEMEKRNKEQEEKIEKLENEQKEDIASETNIKLVTQAILRIEKEIRGLEIKERKKDIEISEFFYEEITEGAKIHDLYREKTAIQNKRKELEEQKGKYKEFLDVIKETNYSKYQTPATPAPTTPAPTTPAPTTPAPTTPAPTTPAPTTPAPTTPAPTTPAPTTPAQKKDAIRINIGRDVEISFDDKESLLPERQSMEIISEDILKETNIGELSATEKMYRILATLGNEGTEELEQIIGRNLQTKDFEQNADRLDDTLITALDHLSSISKDGEKGQSVAREAMKLYLADVLNNKKTPGLAIQYDLEDLSKGKFRSFMNKVPFLKKRSPFLTRQQKDYIYDMAAKSAEFTEPAKGKYFKHSKLLRRFFKDDGKLALPAPKTQDSRESFMTKLQGYKMAEDPHKHMAQYEIDRLNRIDDARNDREAKAKKDSGRDR